MWWNPTPDLPDWLMLWTAVIGIGALFILTVVALREEHVDERRFIHPSQRAEDHSDPS